MRGVRTKHRKHSPRGASNDGILACKSTAMFDNRMHYAIVHGGIETVLE